MQQGRRFTIWAMMLAFAVHCAPGEVDDSGPESATRSIASAGPPSASTSLRAAYVQAVQARAGERFWLRSEGAALVAENPAQGFVSRFRNDGFSLEAAGGEYDLVVSVQGILCGDAFEAVPTEAPAATNNRVEQRHGEHLSAWYLNGPLGLEQGFTVLGPRHCEQELSIVMELEGLAAARQGEQVVLQDGRSAIQLRYVDLLVQDAAGKPVPAWLEAQGQRLRIAMNIMGATFPLHVDPLWVEQSKLLASDGTSHDYFGAALDLDGDTAVVGAYAAGAAGKVYAFQRTGGLWAEQAVLTGGGEFGRAVSVSGDTIVVGAWQYNGSAGNDSGLAYVFERSGGLWTQQQQLSPSDAAAGQHFGYAVSLLGDSLLVGAFGDANNGAAYVFERSGGVWNELQKLKASNTLPLIGFGMAVDLTPALALVGAPFGNSAYVFALTGGVWSEQAELSYGGGDFGAAVSASGDTVVVGAPEAGGAWTDQGAAHVFVGSAGVWTKQQTLTASNATASDYFGVSVSIEGDRILVGSPGANPTATAYFFARSAGVWSEEQLLIPADSGDYFGYALHLDGDTALIGARFDDDLGTNSGSAYVFEVPKELGGVCGQDSQCLNGQCVDGVCCATPCGGGEEADCQACSAAKGSSVDGQCEVLASGSTCRPAAGECDLDEQCDGTDTSCPGDQVVPDGTSCDGGGVCADGVCASGGAGGTAGSGGGTQSTGAGGSSAGGSAVGGGDSLGGSGGAGAPDSPAEAGCGCELPARRASRPAIWLLALLGAMAVRRRQARAAPLRRSAGA